MKKIIVIFFLHFSSVFCAVQQGNILDFRYRDCSVYSLRAFTHVETSFSHVPIRIGTHVNSRPIQWNHNVLVTVFFSYLFVFIFIKHIIQMHNYYYYTYHWKYVCLEKISLNLAADSLSSRNIYPTNRKLKTKNFTNCKRHLVNSLAFRQDNHHIFFSEFIRGRSYTYYNIMCSIFL